MILTGCQIIEEIKKGTIIIDPFDKNLIEPNSYGFRLSNQLITYNSEEIFDVKKPPQYTRQIIPASGLTLFPNKFYLSSTYETIGSKNHAETLYASRSVATMGMWIQFSAALGHTGAIIPWTLEIRVCHAVIVYPMMVIGKIAFWCNKGKLTLYNGKYKNSKSVLATKMHEDYS